MKTLAVATCIAALGGQAAWGQGSILEDRMAPPRNATPDSTPSVRHNFLSAPAAMPRMNGPFGREPLLLSSPVREPQGNGEHHHHHIGGRLGLGHIIGHRDGLFAGSSVNIRGELMGGDFDFEFELGADAAAIAPRHHDIHEHFIPVHGFDFGFGHRRGYYPWYAPQYPIDGVLVVDRPDPVEPAPAEAPEPIELTRPQKAALALRAGHADAAIALLREHLDAESEDAEAMRLLGVALLVDGHVHEGAAMIAMAYEANRSLAHLPLSPANLPRGDAQLRELLREAVVFAHKQDSGAAWLNVIVLMQAEGRERVALRMLDRAVEAGLDDRAAQALRAALAQ